MTVHPYITQLAEYLATPRGKAHYKEKLAEGRRAWADEIAEDPSYNASARGYALGEVVRHIGAGDPAESELEDPDAPRRIASTKNPDKLAAFLNPIITDAWQFNRYTPPAL